MPKVAERSVRCLKVKSVNVCTSFVVYRCGEELGAGSDTYLIASGKPKVKRTGIGFPFTLCCNDALDRSVYLLPKSTACLNYP